MPNLEFTQEQLAAINAVNCPPGYNKLPTSAISVSTMTENPWAMTPEYLCIRTGAGFMLGDANTPASKQKEAEQATAKLWLFGGLGIASLVFMQADGANKLWAVPIAAGGFLKSLEVAGF